VRQKFLERKRKHLNCQCMTRPHLEAWRLNRKSATVTFEDAAVVEDDQPRTLFIL